MGATPAVPTERNPQAEMMGDESMVRNLAMQAEAIWPQELPCFARYTLPAAPQVLDVGCGTGEISARIARHYPGARVIGIDVLEGPLDIARKRYADIAARLDFRTGDAFHLAFPESSFDLSVCRHVLQAVPEPQRVLAELKRVTKPGGWIHTVSEDYGMMQMMSGPLDPDRFWQIGPVQFAERTGTDARFGRKTWSAMRAAGLEEIRVDYAIVDTLRVPRDVFAGILIAWRDGYSDALATHAGMPVNRMREQFDQIIRSIENPDHYAVWFVPIVSARVGR